MQNVPLIDGRGAFARYTSSVSNTKPSRAHTMNDSRWSISMVNPTRIQDPPCGRGSPERLGGRASDEAKYRIQALYLTSYSPFATAISVHNQHSQEPGDHSHSPASVTWTVSVRAVDTFRLKTGRLNNTIMLFGLAVFFYALPTCLRHSTIRPLPFYFGTVCISLVYLLCRISREA